MKYVLIALMVLLAGCVAIPMPLEESVHSVHKGNVLIGEDYAILVIKNFTGEERDNKLLILEKHLKLSQELDKYVDGRGGRIGWPWSKPKEEK